MNDDKAKTVADLMEAVVRVLHDGGFEFALCGGWAVALWGYPRYTEDIDLLIREDQLQDAVKALEPTGFQFVAGRIPLPSQGFEFYRVSAIVSGEVIPLDIYPVESNHPHLKQRAEAVWRNLAVPILEIDDLIEMKSKSTRAKDKADVEELRRIKTEKTSSGDA